MEKAKKQVEPSWVALVEMPLKKTKMRPQKIQYSLNIAVVTILLKQFWGMHQLVVGVLLSLKK